MIVGYGIKMFWPGLFITSPDHLEEGNTSESWKKTKGPKLGYQGQMPDKLNYRQEMTLSYLSVNVLLEYLSASLIGVHCP